MLLLGPASNGTAREPQRRTLRMDGWQGKWVRVRFMSEREVEAGLTQNRRQGQNAAGFARTTNVRSIKTRGKKPMGNISPNNYARSSVGKRRRANSTRRALPASFFSQKTSSGEMLSQPLVREKGQSLTLSRWDPQSGGARRPQGEGGPLTLRGGFDGRVGPPLSQMRLLANVY